jgi:uncharacterized protein YndB with AHSA1/START domain
VANHEIKDAIVIEAPPEQVFRALTEPEALERWLATRVESDVRTGGRFRYDFEFDDPTQNNAQEGEYLAIDPGRRVMLPWTFPFSPKQTRVEYALEPSGEGTSLQFSHDGFESGEPWDGARERFTGGWRLFLEGLKRYVETGEEARPLGIRSRG